MLLALTFGIRRARRPITIHDQLPRHPKPTHNRPRDSPLRHVRLPTQHQLNDPSPSRPARRLPCPRLFDLDLDDDSGCHRNQRPSSPHCAMTVPASPSSSSAFSSRKTSSTRTAERTVLVLSTLWPKNRTPISTRSRRSKWTGGVWSRSVIKTVYTGELDPNDVLNRPDTATCLVLGNNRTERLRRSPGEAVIKKVQAAMGVDTPPMWFKRA
ncbi:hypothetical protein EW146_g3483 [Bondarzewia mesenterica]|uniref:Uncharacterized protein n=1 Tax=Bondarzewia mesenterica TaxID=1095465 RepID=A0A4S4LXE9_9AGAM|nr:hypothetical protein EW146_g3483 [Bondarzewia mesenterica]